ncbi:MAG: hypothetical protein H6607_10835 [Flavobacteriales bacterium]|nr:hypothetical protein [Flavobacteriales bacterium]
MKTHKISLYTVIAAFAIIIFQACKEKEVDPPITEKKVVFNFTEPASGQMYGLNDTVHINGTISYEDELHGYEVTLVNLSNNDSMVFNEHAHIDGKELTVDHNWVNNVTGHSNMELRIDAFIDHEGNMKSDTIHFHCHPM